MKEGAAEHLNDVDPHFSNQSPWSLTLEPLRSHGLDALNFKGIVASWVHGASLREVEIHCQNALHEVTICKSDNLFHRARSAWAHSFPIPPIGTLVRACIDLHLRGEDKPRKLLMLLPDLVQIFPPCDPRLLWALLEKFRLHQTAAKLLAIIALACLPAFDQLLEPFDDDYEHRHRLSMVARS